MLRWIVQMLQPPRLAFGGGAPAPVIPAIPAPPPPPPMLNSPQGAKAADDARRRAQAANGYSGTIMTGPMGDPMSSQPQQKQLTGQ